MYLGVDGLVHALLSKVLLCTQKGLPDGSLSAACGTQQEHTPSYNENLAQLTDLEAEDLVCLIA